MFPPGCGAFPYSSDTAAYISSVCSARAETRAAASSVPTKAIIFLFIPAIFYSSVPFFLLKKENRCFFSLVSIWLSSSAMRCFISG